MFHVKPRYHLASFLDNQLFTFDPWFFYAAQYLELSDYWMSEADPFLDEPEEITWQ